MKAKKSSTTSLIRDVRRKTRRKFSAEEKIRIVLEGMRGEESISEICRKESIHPNQYYKWSKDFMEAAKKRMQGDTQREANTDEVKELRAENDKLKKLVAELSLKNKVLKKSLRGLE
ncbi:transposase [Hyphobacterium sp. CCMP332]|nr:transposase [Hyphobacterium sp. CCMP332]